MSKTLLLIGANVRSQLRWAREHAYIWMILTPVILGMSYLTLSRLGDNIAVWQPSPQMALLVATAFALCLTGLSLSQATTELYHIRRPESYAEALPVRTSTHLNAALASRLLRTSVMAVLLLSSWLLIGGGELRASQRFPAMILFIAVTALTETFAALGWIHLNHTRTIAAAFGALTVIAPSVVLDGALLLQALRPGLMPEVIRLPVLLAGLLWAALLYLIVYRSHERWRASDTEYARRLQVHGRWNIFSARTFSRRLGPLVAAELGRDLQLTLRAFSSAVYVVSGLAALWVSGLVVALTTGLLPPPPVDYSYLDGTWLPAALAIKIACAAVSITLVALLPVLVAYELPLMWVERAVGTTGLDIWQAKLWYARIVSMPAPALAWLAGMMTGQAPWSYSIPLFAECVAIWWLVSSIAGSLSFEMPAQPGLAIITMVTIGMGAGILAAMLWPVGLMIYGYTMHSLTARGRARTRYYLMTEGD
ncbi:MAG TPA: hypothetical protein VFQ92_07685 [Blastocatellia bacterium]|nr:hypothetical protein [Blastocatellia bacterium]